MATNVATGLEIDYSAPQDPEDSSLAPRPSPLFTPKSWEEWITLPIRDQDEAVHTVRGQIRVPTVIVAVNYAKVPKKRPKLCARAIRDRDDNRCQYTGRGPRQQPPERVHSLWVVCKPCVLQPRTVTAQFSKQPRTLRFGEAFNCTKEMHNRFHLPGNTLPRGPPARIRATY